jgi:hypothetical protein
MNPFAFLLALFILCTISFFVIGYGTRFDSLCFIAGNTSFWASIVMMKQNMFIEEGTL